MPTVKRLIPDLAEGIIGVQRLVASNAERVRRVADHELDVLEHRFDGDEQRAPLFGAAVRSEHHCFFA